MENYLTLLRDIYILLCDIKYLTLLCVQTLRTPCTKESTNSSESKSPHSSAAKKTDNDAVGLKFLFSNIFPTPLDQLLFVSILTHEVFHLF